MRPDLCNVSNIIFVGLSIFFRHHLDVPGIGNWFTRSNSLVEILLEVIHGASLDLSDLFWKKRLVLEVRFNVIFHKEGFTLGIHPFKCVSAESIHMTVSIRDSTVRKQEHDVLDTLRSEADEVPGHIWISAISLWISFSTVDNIRKLNRISDEEKWSIVSYYIIIALFCIELDSKPSWISICVRETSFTKSCWESYCDWGSFANSIQEFSFCPLWATLRSLEVSVCARSNCVYDSLWDSFSVKLC